MFSNNSLDDTHPIILSLASRTHKNRDSSRCSMRKTLCLIDSRDKSLMSAPNVPENLTLQDQ